MPVVPITPDDFLALRPLPAGLDVRRDGDLVCFVDRSPGPLSLGGGLAITVLFGFVGMLAGASPGVWMAGQPPGPPPTWVWVLIGVGGAAGLAVGVGLGVWIGRPGSRELAIDTASGRVTITRTDGGHGRKPLVWKGTRQQLRVITCPIRGTTSLDLIRRTVYRGAAAFAVLDPENGEGDAGWLLLSTGEDPHALAHDLWLEAALPDAEVVDEEVVGEVDRWLFRRQPPTTA